MLFQDRGMISWERGPAAGARGTTFQEWEMTLYERGMAIENRGLTSQT